ncbi:hypothetical protein EV383_6268 [Pseudonocardia sediminis]|uniref:Uncharacterized protein n=1 Tax=Pseudonocardia sediminis TaxID=1397368 RepID=A0A4Q7U7R0_PSEST|nr:hypothetical protein [Pseudonocardia sediminis]RZT75527.1 hypothetical protein EV383_6268 [Pseudonocardia sediminis]
MDIHSYNEDGWFSSGADAAHTAWLEEMGHVNDEPPQPGPRWLIVDPQAPGGVRELTRAEQDHCSQLVAATAPQHGEHEPAQDEPGDDEVAEDEPE